MIRKIFCLMTICLFSLNASETTIVKKYFSWETTIDGCSSLAEKIQTAAYQPDILVGISRGGLIPVRILSDLFDNKNVFIIRIAFYEKIGTCFKEPTILQPLSMNLTGKKVLIVDDVADSGKSLQVAIEHIRSLGASEVKTAVLHYKKRSSVVVPDFFVSEENQWLVYPWEGHEHT